MGQPSHPTTRLRREPGSVKVRRPRTQDPGGTCTGGPKWQPQHSAVAVFFLPSTSSPITTTARRHHHRTRRPRLAHPTPDRGSAASKRCRKTLCQRPTSSSACEVGDEPTGTGISIRRSHPPPGVPKKKKRLTKISPIAANHPDASPPMLAQPSPDSSADSVPVPGWNC